MNRCIVALAFLLGAMAVGWVGVGFVGANPLALLMTAIIAAVYLFGALEILEFRRATLTLAAALAVIPDQLSNLADWLDRLHPSLRNPVRLRIEGERVGLPGPALTPYLVGMLVMLGMLGTFLGMVVTLNGAVFALEGTTDLQAIRSALAAPIKGLGLAFGTSVAGVSASAMLGLISALSRRERMLTAQRLDTGIATVLRGFSLAHQRQETLRVLHLQAQALPDLVDRLQAMMEQMERRGEQLTERLLGNQESFHSDVKDVYTNLAGAVDKSLKDSLSESARLAGENIKPAVEAAMTGIARAAKLMHEKTFDSTRMQLDGLSAQFSDTANKVAATWMAALAKHQSTSDSLVAGMDRSLAAFNARFEQGSGSLLASVIAAESERITRHGERMDQLASLWRAELGALRDQEALRGNAAVERLGDLQTAMTSHLTTLSAALEEPIARLMEKASEAPRAAAEVIGLLRQEMTNSVVRDNQLLEERSRIMETLNSLLAAISHSSTEQRATIDSLVASSAVLLSDAGSHFAEQVGAESARLSDIAAQVTSSAVEVSSLSEAFGFAVQLYSDANEKLIASLRRIEASMDKSTARSDEQLAYYVAQAREIIDLSILSQKQVVEDLRQITGRQATTADQVS